MMRVNGVGDRLLDALMDCLDIINFFLRKDLHFLKFVCPNSFNSPVSLFMLIRSFK
jgi:hypothetical protein